MGNRKSPECKIEKICEYCGNKFMGRTKKARFCNNTHYAKCMICGKQFVVTNKKLISNSDWNTLTCSSECAHKKSVQTKRIQNNGNYLSDISIEKLKQTQIQRYGGVGFQSAEIRHKFENTISNKYGDNANYNKIRKQKAQEAIFKKYNSNSPFSSDKIRQKAIETNQKKYGCNYYSQCDEGKHRNSKRMKELYNDGMIAKIQQSNIKKYGVPYTLMLPSIKERIYNTKLEKYGNGYWCNSEQSLKTKINRYGTTSYNNRDKCIETNITRYGIPYTCQLPQVIAKNGNMISKANRKFGELLNDNNIAFSYEYRLDNMSFDLAITNTNILIEIDPIYTHQSTGNRYFGKGSNPPLDKNYHINKTLLAQRHNMQCIHIFDWDNWNKILFLLKQKQTLYARKLDLKEVSKDEADDFLNKYHLQGTCRGQITRLGLYKDNELIEIMTFGKPRYNKNFDCELLRLCTKADYKVVGGAEKLFNAFMKNNFYKTVISYCDVSKFNGNVYERLGFQKYRFSSPSLHWVKGKQHITDNLLRQRGYDQLFGTNYGKGTSNEQLMLDNGWRGIYDCGQLTYIMRGE